MSPKITAKVIKAKGSPSIVEKAEGVTSLNADAGSASEWIPQPPMDKMAEMVEHSTILPQCIRSYKDNIAGFGIGVRYIEEKDEIEEMRKEWEEAERIIDLLSLDMDTKELFENVITARETFGIAYVEIIRNLAGAVVEVSFIRDTPSITKTIPLAPAVETVYYYRGEKILRNKKFRKYRQQKNGKTIYFKEFGDPRIMDVRTGEYMDNQGSNTAIPPHQQANELLEFAVGTKDYGQVRWIGQMINIDGSRRAENLNCNYFENGRHTPLAVIVSNGTLSEDSYARLQEYMDGIKGEAGQHAFLLLEVEDGETRAGFEKDNKTAVELKDMASILQKDELFQNYLDNSRKKIQSSFRLPDLYTAYTTDFNRATAQTAMEITEKQVFQPERESLAWIINNKLLNEYQFKYVEVYFKKPDITNPDDIARLLNITERAGGVTPNMAKQITYTTMGWDGEEDYTEEWGNTPLAVARNALALPLGSVNVQMDAAIEKAVSNRDDDIVPVLKEIKKLLLSMDDRGQGHE